MRILDRYILKKFLLPFGYSFVGFLAIWFIFDLSDNLQDFLGGKAGTAILVEYYLSQIPQIVLISLPISALLALLYSLTAMSRTNEIISMLGAGLSVHRILLPLFGMGFVLVAISAFFNYESAPHAEMIKKQMLKDIKRGQKKEPGLSAHLYRNRENHRIWFMRRILPNQNNLSEIQVLQQDENSNITEEWAARRANWDPITKNWQFQRVKHITLDPKGNILVSEYLEEMIIPGWTETPWRIASSVMNPNYLSVPELEEYLEFNRDFSQVRLAPYRTQLEYRWALPWVCLLVIFIAAPMGIVYSRRGILGGVATAIGLFFALVFFSNLFIALGKGNRISPVMAAWGPLVVFFCVGFVLLWFRSTNRDLPKFKLPWS